MDHATANHAADPRAWIGRTERVEDSLAPEQARAAAAMLDLDPAAFDAGAALPPLWHWFHFLPRAPQAALGEDGHPPRGGFLPPIAQPRRMFAGARVRFHRAPRLGARAVREGAIRDVALKQGRSGTLAFVTVGYRVLQDGALCIEEEQDIVYREQGAPFPPPASREAPPPPDDMPNGAWTRVVVPDPRLLFRFSALTFNAHRIHYDRDYARDVEGYPGLVVHGPLTAMLLLQLVRAHTDRPVAGFTFRGEAPLFDLGPFRLVARPEGDRVALEALAPGGAVALRASADLG